MARYKYATAAECAGFLACEIVDSVEAVFICQLCGSHRDNHPDKRSYAWTHCGTVGGAREGIELPPLSDLKNRKNPNIHDLLDFLLGKLEQKDLRIESLERQLEAVAVGEAPSHLRPHGCDPGHDHVFHDGFATCGRCGASKAMVMP